MDDAAILRDLALQLRELFAPVEAEKNPTRRRGKRWQTRYRAAGLIREALAHGAFSGVRFVQLRALIQAAEIKWATHADRAASDVVDVVYEELASMGYGALPHTNDYKAQYALIAAAVNAEAERLDGVSTSASEDWITQVAAADLIGCAERTILRRIDDGTLASHGPRTARKVSRAEVLAKKSQILRRKARRRE